MAFSSFVSFRVSYHPSGCSGWLVGIMVVISITSNLLLASGQNDDHRGEGVTIGILS